MQISLEPGKYVVAVSGGVDSMCLLNMLMQLPKLELVVAHFDHGIRADSAQDAQFVSEICKQYSIEFVSKRMELGANASEDTARQHRYAFLREVQCQTDSAAIVTAHHQDDLIETALLNVLRGTQRKGLVSLRSTKELNRPLLHMSKEQILEYAKSHKLAWREDSTNSETKYLRNKIRSEIKKTLTIEKRTEIITLLDQILELDTKINEVVDDWLNNQQKDALAKSDLNKMGLAEAYELVAGWLRAAEITFDKDTVSRIVIGARILQNGAQIDVQMGYYCRLTRDQIILKRR